MGAIAGKAQTRQTPAVRMVVFAEALPSFHLPDLLGNKCREAFSQVKAEAELAAVSRRHLMEA